MPLITDPIDNSIEAEQQRVKTRVISRTQNLYVTMLNEYNAIMCCVWQHERLSPQEVLDSLGTKAVELAQLGGALKQFLLTINPQEKGIFPQPRELYVDNGRLVVGAPIEPTPEA